MKYSFALAAFALAGLSNAFWRMECHSRTGLGRIDPLVDPGEISDHSHVIHGGSSKSLTYIQSSVLLAQLRKLPAAKTATTMLSLSTNETKQSQKLTPLRLRLLD